MADRAFRLAAALAYYFVLSLAPVVVVIVGAAGLVWGNQAVEGGLVERMKEFIGQAGAEVVQGIIKHAGSQRRGTTAVIVGLATSFVGAMGVFLQLQDALNTVWNVEPKSGRGLRGFFRGRLVSLAMVLGLVPLLLASLIVDAVLSALRSQFQSLMPGVPALWQAISLGGSMLVLTVLFALIFKFLPDARIQWRDVWIGAVVTGVLFAIGKFVIGLYLGHSTIASPYGAAGSLIVLLVWLYYSSLTLILGAEFTQAWACRNGDPIEPKEFAQRGDPRTK